ncbi:hypothetical protein F4604DRAFT_1917583 [Suillus subluteus]|nr:hypothetical protein F4604DRAFT_1917583 [Suillus subluteus]
MDPITSGVTILQLVQTIAQTSAFLYGYVASVRDAPSSCKSLLDQCNLIRGVLTTVMDIEKDQFLPHNLRRALSLLMAEDGLVVKLDSEMKNLLPNDLTKGKMSKQSRSTWPFEERETGVIADKLRQYYVDITAILAIDSWNTIKEISQGVQELREDFTVQKVTADERQKLLQWMDPMSCTENHATCHGQRNPGTGRWIFHADKYKTWNTSDHAFLWLNGQPGHGKTILASSVIDEIQGSSEAEPQTLGYFYCDFRDDRTTSAAAVLRSLVVQLLQQSQDDWITKINKPRVHWQDEGDLPSLRNLWHQQREAKPHPTDLCYLRKLLVEVSTLVRRPALVIDALDECKDYPDLVGHLVNLSEDARLRLFVTGRSEPDIQEAFHDLPTLSLKDSAEQMKADICVYITEQLKTRKKLSCLSDTLKKTILEKLLEKAEGMFRWVQCQLDEIVACKRCIDIEAALDNLPAGLYETYDRIIQAIKQRGPSDDQIARSCLLWLAGTFTPLTLDQLNEAMMIEVGQSNLNPDLGVTDPMDIVVVCGSLVTYNEKTGVIVLSHYSVKEYLISRPNNIFKSISDMHARICELLITYVLCDLADEICARLQAQWPRHDNIAVVSKDHPLLSYATQGCKHLGYVSAEDPCIMDALSWLNSEFRRNTWKNRVLTLGEHEHGPRWFPADVTLPSLLFIPLEHGKPWMVESLVKQDPHLLDVDIARGWGPPLIFAIAKNPDCLSILLKPGIDFNKLSSFSPRLYNQCCWGDSYAPISWAAVTGSEVAVDFLLSQTEVDIPNDILKMAVSGTKPSHECIRKFRQRGADVNFTVNGFIPIHTFIIPYTIPSSRDRSQLLPGVRALVEPSCNLSLQDWAARTVLHIALDARLEDIVTYLLERGAGVSATATLLPDMWSWAKNKPWFPKVQAAVLAADQPCTRIKGKVVDATANSQIVEFSYPVTADRDNPNPICTVVVSVIRNDELSSRFNGITADLSCCNQSLQKDIQDSAKNDSPRLWCPFWGSEGRVSSCTFRVDSRQGDTFTRMLQQLTEDKDSTGTSLFLHRFKDKWETDGFEHGVGFVLDIYRGPLP